MTTSPELLEALRALRDAQRHASALADSASKAALLEMLQRGPEGMAGGYPLDPEVVELVSEVDAYLGRVDHFTATHARSLLPALLSLGSKMEEGKRRVLDAVGAARSRAKEQCPCTTCIANRAEASAAVDASLQASTARAKQGDVAP